MSNEEQKKAEEELLRSLQEGERTSPLRDADLDARIRQWAKDIGMAVDDETLAQIQEQFSKEEIEEIIGKTKIVDGVLTDVGGEPELAGGELRGSILDEANSLVNGDRNAAYGDPKQDFARTAAYWTIYLQGVVEREKGRLILRPHDIAIMMNLLKTSRLAWSPNKRDHWVDTAGYAACGADCASASYGGLK